MELVNFLRMSIKEDFMQFIHETQDELCAMLEAVDGRSKFQEDKWERAAGGGGKTRVIANGAVIEKGGVNTSIVFGDLTETMKKALQMQGSAWFACGISVVIHPFSPLLPTVHCNYRMFELYDGDGTVLDRWFGGGSDLTPYYLEEQDAILFHQTHKNACDSMSMDLFTKYKKQCDDYFVNTHRGNERRGVGGIFYDHERISEERSASFWISLARKCAKALVTSYEIILKRNDATEFSAAQKYWQEIRRGRYVEFNLLHDRGTIFGLKTDGRTESILMSLPPTVRFDYQYSPAANSKEAELLDILMQPKDWV